MRNATRRILVATAGVGLVSIIAACTPAAPDPAPVPAAPPPTTAAPPPNPCQSAPTQSGATGTDYVLVTRRDDKLEVHRFHANSEADKDEQLAKAAQGSDVLAVEPDQPVQAADPPAVTDALATDQWGVDRSHFSDAWATDEGTDVRIAVIDSGVQGDHEDLAGQVVAGKDFVTPGVTDGMVDFYGHGTHVAGIAAAALNGVGGVGGAPAAKIVSARVLNCSGAGSIYNVELGIVWAATPVVDGGGGAQVINLSLGAFVDSPSLDAVIDSVESQGVVVVAAAGNCGMPGDMTLNNSSLCPAPLAGEAPDRPKALYPAASGNTIAVGAIDSTDGRAYFSNSGAYVDLAAPGQAILSSCPAALGAKCPPYNGQAGYSLKSGTSMATPFVAAAAAILAAACPVSTRDATWVQFVKTQLETTAEDLPTPLSGRDDEFGFGLVRPDRAIDPLNLTCPA